MINQIPYGRFFFASSLGCALVALVMACGDDAALTADPTPDGSSPEAAAPDGAAQTDAPVSADTEAFCKGTLGLYAPRFEACCDPTAAPKLYSFDDTLLKGLLLACTTSLGKSVASGRATFVPAAAATCQANVSAAIQGRACPDVLRAPSNQPSASIFNEAAGCQDAVVGRQGADAPCSNDYECVDGLTCIGWTAQSDGTCKTPPAEAALCGYAIPDGGGFIELVRWGFGTHPRCAAGLYCASTASQQGVCRVSKAADAACGSSDECAAGLRCQNGACGTGAPAPADAPCERNSDCQDRLFCKSADGGRVCAPRGVAGTSCSNAFGSECQGACVEPDGGTASCVAFCGSL